MNTALRSRLALLCLLVLVLPASGVLAQVRRELHIPDIMGYKTLKCDFHMHTVFSDGAVWPTVRVDEAWQEGLDALAITDHIEYQPHKGLSVPATMKQNECGQATGAPPALPPGEARRVFETGTI